MKFLSLCLFIFTLNTNAVTFDPDVVDTHIRPGLEALRGNSAQGLSTEFWKELMTVTKCTSGKKYYEKPFPRTSSNLLKTTKTKKGNIVFRYLSSQVSAKKMKRNVYQIDVMDNSQAYQGYLVAKYTGENGRTYLALANPEVFSGRRSCQSITVMEPF